MTPKPRPAKAGMKAFSCRNCGNTPIFEPDPEFTTPECPRCGETTFIKDVPRGPP